MAMLQRFGFANLPHEQAVTDSKLTSKSKSRYVQVREENTYSSLSNHNEAKLSSSSSTIGLDAQPSARPTALQSSRLMWLDSVPSSIATHSTISTRYAVSCAIPYLTARQRLAHFHFRFQFPFPFSVSSFHSTSISCFSICPIITTPVKCSTLHTSCMLPCSEVNGRK